MAFVALVVALSGVAYAAAPRNSVVSKSIKDGAVKNKDLANDSVDSAKTAAESLAGTDIANDSLTGADVAGLTGADISYGAHVVTDNGLAGNQTETVFCPAGEIATGGGGTTIDPPDTGALLFSIPAGNVINPSGWQVTYQSAIDSNGDFLVYAVCIPA